MIPQPDVVRFLTQALRIYTRGHVDASVGLKLALDQIAQLLMYIESLEAEIHRKEALQRYKGCGEFVIELQMLPEDMA